MIERDRSDVAVAFFSILVEQIRHHDGRAKSQQSDNPPCDVLSHMGALAIALNDLFERSWLG